MAKYLFLITLLISLFTFAQSASSITLPARGSLKSNVEAAYGQPNRRLGPVGNPPISQWVYDQFTVVFEYEHVIHAYRRDLELENRPQSAVPPRPSSLTLPNTENTDTTETQVLSPAEPEPVLVDDREETSDSFAADNDTDSDNEFDAIFDSDNGSADTNDDEFELEGDTEFSP